MFKKLVNLTACAATVFAQEEAAAEPAPEFNIVEGEPMALATATDGDIVSSGFTGETYWE